jgi:hypothetical protein
MHRVVLENKKNKRKIYERSQLTSYMFRLFGVIFRLIFETCKEVYRSGAEGRSRLLQVFVTSLVFTYTWLEDYN